MIADDDGTHACVMSKFGPGSLVDLVHQWDLPPSWGPLSFVQIAASYGRGLVDFDSADVNLDKLNNAYLFRRWRNKRLSAL